MGEKRSQIVPSDTETKLEKHPSGNEFSMSASGQVAMALGALDSRYKENVASYAQALHAATHNIEMAKIELEEAETQKEPLLRALDSLEKEVDHALRTLTELTERWQQEAEVLQELKRVAQTEEIRQRVAYKEESFHALEQQIESLEVTLLEHELEKENLSLKIEPVEQKIRALKKRLAELEAEKRYIETNHLHQITRIGMEEENKSLPETLPEEKF